MNEIDVYEINHIRTGKMKSSEWIGYYWLTLVVKPENTVGWWTWWQGIPGVLLGYTFNPNPTQLEEPGSTSSTLFEQTAACTLLHPFHLLFFFKLTYLPRAGFNYYVEYRLCLMFSGSLYTLS